MAALAASQARRRAAPAPPERPKSQSLTSYLLQPIHAPGLAAFRFVFAAAMAYDAFAMHARSEMDDFFCTPHRLTFAYRWTPFITPLSCDAMLRLPHVIGAAAILFGSGLLPVVGLLAFAVAYTFLFLAEATRYVNHFYLYSMLGWLLLGAALSSPSRLGFGCRRYQLYALRLQISFVYFFGGLVKLQREFLVELEPLRSYVRAAAAHFGADETARPWSLALAEPSLRLAAVGACAFDLLAPLALWSPRLRWPAFGVALAFHGLNHFVLFRTIGSFPLVSLATCALFLDAAPAAAAAARPSRASLLPLYVTAAHLAVQALVPLRHHWHSADVSWTRLGNEFGWRMMGDTTDGFLQIELGGLVVDGAPVRRSVYPVSASRYSDRRARVTVNAHQTQQLLAMPDALEQYVAAEALHACGGATDGCAQLRVTLDCWKSVNGRPYRRFCDPTFDWNAGGALGLGARLAAVDACVARRGEGADRRGCYREALTRGGGAALPFSSAWPPRWMVARPLGDDPAEAAAVAARRRWERRAIGTVEAFVHAPHATKDLSSFVDRILPGAAPAGAWVLCVHGMLGVEALRGGDAPNAEAETFITAGEAHRLVVNQHFRLRAVGRPLAPDVAAAWLYVMPRRGEEEAMRRALAENS